MNPEDPELPGECLKYGAGCREGLARGQASRGVREQKRHWEERWGSGADVLP